MIAAGNRDPGLMFQSGVLLCCGHTLYCLKATLRASLLT